MKENQRIAIGFAGFLFIYLPDRICQVISSPPRKLSRYVLTERLISLEKLLLYFLAERPDPALKIIFLILLTKHFPKFRFIHPAVAILMNNML